MLTKQVMGMGETKQQQIFHTRGVNPSARGVVLVCGKRCLQKKNAHRRVSCVNVRLSTVGTSRDSTSNDVGAISRGVNLACDLTRSLLRAHDCPQVAHYASCVEGVSVPVAPRSVVHVLQAFARRQPCGEDAHQVRQHQEQTHAAQRRPHQHHTEREAFGSVDGACVGGVVKEVVDGADPRRDVCCKREDDKQEEGSHVAASDARAGDVAVVVKLVDADVAPGAVGGPGSSVEVARLAPLDLHLRSVDQLVFAGLWLAGGLLFEDAGLGAVRREQRSDAQRSEDALCVEERVDVTASADVHRQGHQKRP
eukprot:Rhum_TRINITY_DN3177_c0_g1::Rhum_TRINITY_DN3177_c0_g1_i1::g.9876::m.9876